MGIITKKNGSDVLVWLARTNSLMAMLSLHAQGNKNEESETFVRPYPFFAHVWQQLASLVLL